MLRFDSLGDVWASSKNQVLTLEFYFLYFAGMKKENCRGLVISKKYLELHHPREYWKLNELLGTDWYIYQYYTIYCLVVWECETSFISLKFDLDKIIDGIGFWLLLAKHWK